MKGLSREEMRKKKKGQVEIDRESSCDTLVKFEEFGVSTNHGHY